MSKELREWIELMMKNHTQPIMGECGTLCSECDKNCDVYIVTKTKQMKVIVNGDS